MKLTDKPTIPQKVMAREVGDEVVILDLASGSYYGLDAVGARVWQLIGAGKTLGETVEILMAEFEVDRQRLESDLLSLADKLEAQGLLTAPR